MALHRFNEPDVVFSEKIENLFRAVYLSLVTNTSDATEGRFEPSSSDGMLDDPALSRQWVARRLQRALSVERWGTPLRVGLAGGKDGPHRILALHAAAAEARAQRLVELIRLLGSEPYSVLGVSPPLTRTAGRTLAALSRRLADRAAEWLAEHTLGEYDALEAFMEDALGIPAEISYAIAPLHQQVLEEVRSLQIIGGRAI